MKKLYPYSKFISEGIRDKMTPKSEDSVKSSLDNLSALDKLKKAYEIGFKLNDFYDETELEKIYSEAKSILNKKHLNLPFSSLEHFHQLMINYLNAPYQFYIIVDNNYIANIIKECFDMLVSLNYRITDFRKDGDLREADKMLDLAFDLENQMISFINSNFDNLENFDIKNLPRIKYNHAGRPSVEIIKNCIEEFKKLTK